MLAVDHLAPLDRESDRSADMTRTGDALSALTREGLVFGCDYNPEQWSREVWAEDVRLMREAGVNIVNLGIFSWARIQTGPNTWDFTWLDEVMDLLHDNGITVDLATATASPPAWLTTAHPEILPVTHTGETLWPGARQHWRPTSARLPSAKYTWLYGADPDAGGRVIRAKRTRRPSGQETVMMCFRSGRSYGGSIRYFSSASSSTVTPRPGPSGTFTQPSLIVSGSVNRSSL